MKIQNEKDWIEIEFKQYAKENELDMEVSDIKKVNETYDVIGYERVEDFEISNPQSCWFIHCSTRWC